MNYVLIVVLVFLLLAIYFLNGRRIISASLITNSVFLLSAIVFASFKDYFSHDISISTVLIIASTIILIFIGERIGYSVISKRELSENHHYSVKPTFFHYSKEFVIVVGSLSILFAAISYYQLYQKSLAYGNPGNIFKAVAYTREVALNSTNSTTPVYTYLNIAFQGLSYVCLFVYLYNSIFFSKKDYVLFLPMIGTVLYQITTTERIGFIRIIAVFITIYAVLIKYKAGWGHKNDARIVKTALIGVLLFMLIFFFLGSMSDRLNISLWSNSLANYLGAPIFGIDYYIMFPWEANFSFGQHVFRDVYEVANIAGANITLGDAFLPFFTWGAEHSSNVYTSIASPLHDFGLIGFLLTRFLIGIIYGLIVRRIENISNVKSAFLKIIFFGLLMYPVCMASIADSFMFFIQLPTIYLFISILLFGYIFKRTSLKKSVNAYAI